jgi:S1-C subfamily serine protease
MVCVPAKRWMAAAGALPAAALVCVYAAGLASAGVTGDAEIRAAVCPVVYPLDESAAERGVHYTFYGNSFFIDEHGYLVTAAHVLSDFRDGGQPHILLRRPNAPPRVIKVEVLATDAQHDIAILRALPNPFEGNYAVAFLRLGMEKPALGTVVVAEALRPSRLNDPHTFDAPCEERSPAGILQYTTTKLEKGQAAAELFLFDHQVQRGQSGAPVIARDTQEVLGIVEGQWFGGMASGGIPAAANRTSNIGAAVPIVYALPLLEEKKDSVAHSDRQGQAQPLATGRTPAPDQLRISYGVV